MEHGLSSTMQLLIEVDPHIVMDSSCAVTVFTAKWSTVNPPMSVVTGRNAAA